MDLLEVNAKIVRGVAENIARYAPSAVVIVVSNPLDEMTALAQMATAGVEAMTLGSHGDTMVPVPSLVRVDGKPIRDLLSEAEIDDLVQQTREGGAEIVALLKTGSAYYAPSAAAARMVQAVHQDSGATMPVCTWVDGAYGISGVFLGVPAQLGRGGVKKVVELDLADDELAALRQAAEAVRTKQADVANL
jgi:malate dehydrogenase